MKHTLQLCLLWLVQVFLLVQFVYGETNDTGTTDLVNIFDRSGSSSIATRLVVDHPQKTRFVRLSCNNNLFRASCKTWTSMFGTGSVHSKLIVIPCGQCVIMNYSGTVPLILQGGIDIVGKLVFPDNYKITIQSSMVVVQGFLEMTSTKPIDGTPTINLTMISNVDMYFIARDENSHICPLSRCLAGKKAVTVAGGKITIKGIAPGTPTWVNLYNVTATSLQQQSVTEIVVDVSVKGKWQVGAEILITSHTHSWTNQQVNRIVSITDFGARFVRIKLKSAIQRPTTIVQSPNFAVEVALLSRNIVFRGGVDNVPNHGGHFWIMFTPTILQTVEGVDFVNFGQQGTLGRYPIHFHMCGSMKGSIISKNTIRQSNQRCIVIHGTNDVQISNNVAYDTKGHCYILEDGIETGNIFYRNLGALTKIPQRLISAKESDKFVSTFWITNPQNSWQGNVAAGSEVTGYWIEPLKRGTLADQFPQLQPRFDGLILFKNNVAHSNNEKGFRTYPTGYEPINVGTSVMDGVKAYRNNGGGVFFHISRRIILQNSFIADNKGVNVDIDRADAIQIINTDIVGISSSYRYFIDQQSAPSVCHFDSFVGIDLHTWKNNPNEMNIVELKRVRFNGFSTNNCPKAIPIRFDDVVRSKQFDFYTSLRAIDIKGIDVMNGVVNFCDASAVNVNDAYINVLDGRLRASDPIQDPVALISKSNNMLAFVNRLNCKDNISLCHTSCKWACFSSFRFGIDPANTEQYKLRVCSSTSPFKCILVTGGKRGDDPKLSSEYQTFLVHVPRGTYTATVLDENGQITWPMFVTQRSEHSECEKASLPQAIVTLNVPSVPVSECNQLVRNSFMEMIIDSKPKYWLHRFGGIELVFNKGIGRSTAIGDVVREGQNVLGQYLDSRCIRKNVGTSYEATAYLKINGRTTPCNPNITSCPQIGIYTDLLGFILLGNVQVEMDKDGFQKTSGILQIDSDLIRSETFFFFIRSYDGGQQLLVDNVTFKKV